jgi:hypothetical protein
LMKIDIFQNSNKEPKKSKVEKTYYPIET